MPNTTAVPSEMRLAAPAPVAKSMGITPNTNESAVMRGLGAGVRCRRFRLPHGLAGGFVEVHGVLHDENCVLAAMCRAGV